MKNIPSGIKNFLIRQEHSLNIQNLETNQINGITKKIAKKINRPEDQLLIKNIDDYRIKKEVKDIVEANKNIYDIYGQKGW